VDPALLGFGSAVVVAAATSVTTVQLARLANRAKERDKQQDWGRQDEVAARAERAVQAMAASQALIARQAAQEARDAAARLLAAQQASIARTDEVARLAAERGAAQSAQLRDIHVLVNSDMTAARQEALDQTRLTLLALEKLVQLDRAAGREPTDADLAAVDEAKVRVDELQAVLADRLAQQRILEAHGTGGS
jgi:hypothetical protein